MEARQALADGTYFVLGGVVTDSRGRELGPVEEVLGPDDAEASHAEASHAEASHAEASRRGPAAARVPAAAGALRTGGGDGGRGSTSQTLSSHRGDPARSREMARDHGALHHAELGELRDALDGMSTMGSTGNASIGRLPNDQPWVPGGAAALSATVGAAPKQGTIKGGCSIVKSSAPKPVGTARLTEAEMEANWANLS